LTEYTARISAQLGSIFIVCGGIGSSLDAPGVFQKPGAIAKAAPVASATATAVYLIAAMDPPGELGFYQPFKTPRK
jgi:hypothetical protein